MTVNPDKHDDAKYGVVEAVPSELSVSIRLRGKIFSINVLPKLVIPNCLVGGKVAKNAEMRLFCDT